MGAAAAFAVLKLPFVQELPLFKEKLSHIFQRLAIWEDPVAMIADKATRDAAWQPAQSLFAISSGGFWGLGIGKSNQKHGFLPEPQNDYVFAILCEELGFFGAVGVILLFAAFAYRGFRIAANSPNRFCSLVVMGLIAAGCLTGDPKHRRRDQYVTLNRHFTALFQLRRHVAGHFNGRDGRNSFHIAVFLYRKGIDSPFSER